MKKWLIVPLLCIANMASAQSLTHAMDNYQPTQGISINPSFSAAAKPYIDINFISGYGLIRSDYVYYANGISGLIGGRLDDFNFDLNRNAQATIDGQLPSTTIVLGNFSLGLSTRIRASGTVKDAPSHIGKFFFDGLAYEPLHNNIYKGEDFYLKGLSWGEINLNGAGIVHRSQSQLGTFGANLKILRGLAGASLLVNDLSYSVDSTNLYIYNSDFEYAMAVPGANKGSGLGLDLGYTHYWLRTGNGNFLTPHKKSGGCREIDYKFKLGVSILDFGRIKMSNDQSRSRSISSDTVFWGPYGEGFYDGLSEYDLAILSRFENQQANVAKEDFFKASLPTTLSIQADYALENSFYLYGLGQLAIRRKHKFAAERMNMFTLGLRYEKPRFMAALPVTVYQYKSPTIGLHFRVFPLSIGTHNVIGLFHDTFGSDVYIALKWQILKSRDCRRAKVKRKSCPKPKKYK